MLHPSFHLNINEHELTCVIPDRFLTHNVLVGVVYLQAKTVDETSLWIQALEGLSLRLDFASNTSRLTTCLAVMYLAHAPVASGELPSFLNTM